MRGWILRFIRLLHEACHYICMAPERRAGFDRDAGGDDLEESAVCYLQVLLADELPGVGRERLCADMDAWGYSFRLGNAGLGLKGMLPTPGSGCWSRG